MTEWCGLSVLCDGMALWSLGSASVLERARLRFQMPNEFVFVPNDLFHGKRFLLAMASIL